MACSSFPTQTSLYPATRRSPGATAMMEDVMGDGHEFMLFSELRGGPPLIDDHARRARRAPLRMIRKRGCAVVGQGQMIVLQYPEGFEAGSTARGGSCTPW